MIIFLYGPDEYRRREKKRELIAEFTKKRSDLGLATFDLAAAGALDRFEEFSRSRSLFDPAKLAIFENAFELAAAELAKLLQPFIADKGITILVSEREKPVKALAFLLEKPTVAQKFENLTGAEWLQFLAAEAKRLGVTVSLPAGQFLASVYAGNSWALATELQKLAAWQAGEGASKKKMIERADLEVFDLEVAPNYWILLNGLKSPDPRVRLGTLEKLFAMGDPPAKIFNILAASPGGSSAGAQEKTAHMAAYDVAVKSGKLEYEEALVEFVLG